jgi:hypothetical protein
MAVEDSKKQMNTAEKSAKNYNRIIRILLFLAVNGGCAILIILSSNIKNS